MTDKDKKVVNTEEQNRPVNPQDKDYKENRSASQDSSQLNTVKNSNPGETEKPDEGEIERPHRIEGDDADSIERKIPNM